MALRHVRPGEPLRIPAADYNAFVDAALDHQARRLGRTAGGGGVGRDTGTVLVRNDSGANRDRSDVLGLDGPVFDPTDEEQIDEFAGRVVLAGLVPTAEHAGRFAVLLEPVANGEIGRACVVGVCPVRVNILDEQHAYADVEPETPGRLQSAPTGAAHILCRGGEGTGEKWAYVRMGPPWRRGFWAEVTGGEGATYAWKMLEDDASTAMDPEVTGQADEVNDSESVPVGSVIWVWASEAAGSPPAVEYRFFYRKTEYVGPGAGPTHATLWLSLLTSTYGEAYTVDERDWRGLLLAASVAWIDADTREEAEAKGVADWTRHIGVPLYFYCGADAAGRQDLLVAGLCSFFIDGDDGGKLKVEVGALGAKRQMVLDLEFRAPGETEVVEYEEPS